MPARRQPRSVAEQVDDELSTEISDLVSQIAAEEGPAPHAQYVSDDHEVGLWGQMDPQVDHETLVQQLMQGAVPPELVDPASDRPLALIKNQPELAQLFAEPLDQEMAQMVATLAEYPFRLSLLAPYTDDPEASVKKADRLTARWRRQRDAGRSAPVPAQPMPSPAVPAAPPPGAPEPLGAPIPPPAAPVPVPSLAGPRVAPGGAAGAAPPLPRPQPGGY